MDYIELTKTLIELLVNNKDAVSVSEYETDEEDVVQLEVMVDKDDLGTVIGKNGRMIHSIRNIVQVGSSLNGGKKIRINVDSY